MSKEIITRRIAFNGVCSTYAYFIKCERCGKEIQVYHPKQTRYCADCKPIVIAEGNRKRQAAWRQRQKLKNNGY